METLIVIILIALVIGILTRNKGDSFLDTLSSGCSSIIWIVLILGIINNNLTIN
jgi:uncharacterized ion transporter superfamily protein YfcC